MKNKLEEKLIANGFQQKIIKDYIIKNASDTLAEKILNGNKNINDCLFYVATEMYEAKMYIREGNAGLGIANDDWVFGQVMHYFEEDSIPVFDKFSPSNNKKKNEKEVEDADEENTDNDDVDDEEEEKKPKKEKPKAQPKKAPKKKETKVEQVRVEIPSLFDFM